MNQYQSVSLKPDTKAEIVVVKISGEELLIKIFRAFRDLDSVIVHDDIPDLLEHISLYQHRKSTQDAFFLNGIECGNIYGITEFDIFLNRRDRIIFNRIIGTVVGNRTYGTDKRTAVQCFLEKTQRIVQEPCIVVEQEDITFGICGSDAYVTSTGKTGIFFHEEEYHGEVIIIYMITEPLVRTVGGRIIDKDDFYITGVAMALNAVQTVFCQLVVII
ncbi:MAG: hypothetical protein BWY61_02114 [Firmicutes bacterium ADurb.Bin354]|nr:MAG: hypothetical protein BWY61_02114 [Firmicutes bacterium ADurb.Bin354]